MDETTELLNARRAKFIRNQRKSFKDILRPHFNGCIIMCSILGTMIILVLIIYKYNSLQHTPSNTTNYSLV